MTLADLPAVNAVSMDQACSSISSSTRYSRNGPLQRFLKSRLETSDALSAERQSFGI
jgi:hypothetical protein